MRDLRDFLIDTQTIRYWYDADCSEHQAVVENIESWRRQVESAESWEHKPRLLVSVVTLGEIEFGLRVNPALDLDTKGEYLQFVARVLPVRLEVTIDVAPAFGEFRKQLFDKFVGKKRKPGMRPEQLVDPITSKELGIQENDLWLCAQAITHDMVLVTNDKMLRIREVSQGMEPALRIQNWANPNTAKLE